MNLLLNAARADGRVAFAIASSGIAALLLDGGCTAHSRFGIPLNVAADSIANMDKQSDKAKLLKRVELIIWDEAPMMHKHCYEAADRTLCDFMDAPNTPSGGKVVVLAGDFRQILPVVHRGTWPAIVRCCPLRLTPLA